MNFWSWLITSSQDPRYTSLAVKAALTTFGAYLVQSIAVACSLGIACIDLDNNTLQSVIDLIANVVLYGTMLIGTLTTLFGLLRKWASGQWSHPDAGTGQI